MGRTAAQLQQLIKKNGQVSVTGEVRLFVNDGPSGPWYSDGHFLAEADDPLFGLLKRHKGEFLIPTIYTVNGKGVRIEGGTPPEFGPSVEGRTKSGEFTLEQEKIAGRPAIIDASLTDGQRVDAVPLFSRSGKIRVFIKRAYFEWVNTPERSITGIDELKPVAFWEEDRLVALVMPIRLRSSLVGSPAKRRKQHD
jgi:hypothetical protein